jgi:hypothetical protein
MEPVNVLGMTHVRQTDGAGEGVRSFGYNHEVNVVGHQAPGDDVEFEPARILREPIEIHALVLGDDMHSLVLEVMEGPWWRGRSALVAVLLGLAGLFGLGAILLWRYSRRRSATGATARLPAKLPVGAPVREAAGPRPAQDTEAPSLQQPMPETAKLHQEEVTLSMRRPSTIRQGADSTLKMMPGYFEVLSGTAKGRRVHIYSSETTIGRGRGGPGHIGFDPEERSVSRSQAKLRYDPPARAFRLVNQADPLAKNSTVINGQELGQDDMVELKEGVRVRFGEIELEFHELKTASAN